MYVIQWIYALFRNGTSLTSEILSSTLWFEKERIVIMIYYRGLFQNIMHLSSWEEHLHSSKPRWTTGYIPIWLAFGHKAQAPEPLSFGPVAVGESEDPDIVPWTGRKYKWVQFWNRVNTGCLKTLPPPHPGPKPMIVRLSTSHLKLISQGRTTTIHLCGFDGGFLK